MKILFIVIVFFIFINLYSLELRCNFEEVYQDGSTHQGILLLKKEYLRYQYLNKNLYTIINNSDGLFLVNNLNRLPQPLDINKEIIEFLIDQSQLFPNNVENYSSTKFNAKIIKSKENIFIKNLIIKNKKMNLNIHFINCKNITIDRLMFNHNPLQNLK